MYLQYMFSFDICIDGFRPCNVPSIDDITPLPPTVCISNAIKLRQLGHLIPALCIMLSVTHTQ